MIKSLGMLLAYILMVLAINSIMGFIVLIFWNWLMPYLFHLPKIGFWMAWGIGFIVIFLFGSAYKMRGR